MLQGVTAKNFGLGGSELVVGFFLGFKPGGWCSCGMSGGGGECPFLEVFQDGATAKLVSVTY